MIWELGGIAGVSITLVGCAQRCTIYLLKAVKVTKLCLMYISARCQRLGYYNSDTPPPVTEMFTEADDKLCSRQQ